MTAAEQYPRPFPYQYAPVADAVISEAEAIVAAAWGDLS